MLTEVFFINKKVRLKIKVKQNYYYLIYMQSKVKKKDFSVQSNNIFSTTYLLYLINEIKNSTSSVLKKKLPLSNL